MNCLYQNFSEILIGSHDQVTKEDFLAYAWVSGDHNPIHFDDQIAISMGIEEGILAQGMLVHCWICQYFDVFLENESKEKKVSFFIEESQTKFNSKTHPGTGLDFVLKLKKEDEERVYFVAEAVDQKSREKRVTQNFVVRKQDA